MIKAIYGAVYKGMTIDEVANQLGTPLKQIQKWVSRFKRWVKIRAKSNLQFLGKKRILKDWHVKYIRSNVQQKAGTPLTLEELRNKLRRRFAELVSISKSTVGRWLHNDLNFSYKKMSTANIKLFDPENTLKMIKWAWVINKLLKLEHEVVFLDEFSISSRSFKTYGWSPKGEKAMWSKYPDNFSMSIMAAFSQRRYYKIYGTDKTF